MPRDQVEQKDHLNTLANPHGVAVVANGPDGHATQGFVWLATMGTPEKDSEHCVAVPLYGDDDLVLNLAKRFSPSPPTA